MTSEILLEFDQHMIAEYLFYNKSDDKICLNKVYFL